ncbi:MAG: type I-C CRISPR-associated protein Cas8c/Csd1 [Oscillospiraceae bacterium]|nr:type I-C CRISPR-associated protein Cas8c/Csd1 [Oscillospiraceae bacterium]
MFHAFINTDVVVRLSGSGRFISAEYTRERIAAPVTEHSVCRTNGIEPHPLYDRLCYLTPECGEAKKYIAYMKRLNGWADSVFSTQALIAVRDYLDKGCIAYDLFFNAHIKNDGRLTVRFEVDGVALWEDKSLQDSYISYVRSNAAAVDICCIKGEFATIASVHQKHITNEKSSAKLISLGERDRIMDERTESRGFSYPVGMECSFKMHAVLRRLISNNGVHAGYKVFVVWDSAGNTVQLPFYGAEKSTLPQGEVTVMAFDEISKGRLFVSFHRRITAHQYAMCMSTWKNAVDIGIIHIAQQAFGRMNNGSCAAGVVENTIQRMVSCLLDRRKQPADIISALVRRDYKASADSLRYYNELIERSVNHEDAEWQNRFSDADIR